MNGKIFLRAITKINFFILFIFLTLQCGNGVDVYLRSGENRCSVQKKTSVEVVAQKPGSQYDEIGTLSIRYGEAKYREEALKILKNQASKCGADLIHYLPVKKIYNRWNVQAAGEKTGTMYPSLYEQKVIMYRRLRQ